MTPATGLLLGTHGRLSVRPGGALRPGRPRATWGLAGETIVVTAMAWLLVVACLAGWSLLPMLAGWRPVVITSGSMVPAIRPGDVVLIDPKATDIRPGHVIFVKPLRPGAAPVTHRVVRIEDDGDIVTKGDANRVEDSTPVPRDRVGGVARLAVPNAGRIALAWLRGSPGDWAWTGLTLASILVVGLSLVRRDPADALTGPDRDVDEVLADSEHHPFFIPTPFIPTPRAAEPPAPPEAELEPEPPGDHAIELHDHEGVEEGEVPLEGDLEEEAVGLPPLGAHGWAHGGGAAHAAGRAHDRIDEGRSSDGISYDLGLGYPTDSLFVPHPRVPALPERLPVLVALLPPEPPPSTEPPREHVDLPVLRLMPAGRDRDAVVVGVRTGWTKAFVPLQRGLPSGRHVTAGRR